MHVLLALTDADPSSSRPGTPVQAPAASPGPTPGIAARLTEMLVQQGFNILFNPFRLHGLARLGTGTMAAMSKLLWRPRDPNTIFKGELGIPKQVAWSRPVPLADVKAVGRAVEGTVNDVMLAAATGALRRYLVDRGEAVQGLSIRAGVSVNLRAPSIQPSLGNQAGAVLVELPVGLNTALDRLLHVKRGIDEIKNSPEPSVVWALMNALGKAPADTQEKLVQTYCTRETAVIANVPGPGETVYLAGAPLSSLMFWVPALGGAGLCLSIASYAGQVWFGVGTDQGLVPDPDELIAGFHAEFDALQHLTRESEAEPDATVVSEGPFEAMNALLDQAIVRVDELLEGR
jgi:WS/DGAT/MGAT family acyltransferase